MRSPPRSKSNVLVQLDHLRTYPAVAEAESEGALTLHGCFYRFETGEVTVFDGVAGNVRADRRAQRGQTRCHRV